ncbi:alba DNA/RNA-binding protein [Actinidia rufa]|uniref:Alba DNA/RNA-binding protein n=1 Tax=Actinidia rufa TaxID=165716 RepID=A0A7J0H3L4_9ERIC|nr:alba DNA/RNA-binding protein [Actinidia rufa]
MPRLHQDTAISSVSITDVWEPIEEGLFTCGADSPGLNDFNYLVNQGAKQELSRILMVEDEAVAEEGRGRGWNRGGYGNYQENGGYSRGGYSRGGYGNYQDNDGYSRAGYGNYKENGGYSRGGYGNYQENGGYSRGGYGNYQENGGGYSNAGRGGGRGRGRDYRDGGYERGRGGGGRGYSRGRGRMGSRQRGGGNYQA